MRESPETFQDMRYLWRLTFECAPCHTVVAWCAWNWSSRYLWRVSARLWSRMSDSCSTTPFKPFACVYVLGSIYPMSICCTMVCRNRLFHKHFAASVTPLPGNAVLEYFVAWRGSVSCFSVNRQWKLGNMGCKVAIRLCFWVLQRVGKRIPRILIASLDLLVEVSAMFVVFGLILVSCAWANTRENGMCKMKHL